MHSRIFELSDTPVPANERVKEFCIPEWFCSTIADYVDDDTDRKNDIEWLMSCMGGIATLENGSTIVYAPDARKQYFARRYERFMKAIEQIKNVTLEGFAGIDRAYNVDGKMSELRDAYEDKFGFYIFYKEQLMTEDEWMRFADLTKPYYIGGTIDYHF